MFRKNGCQGTPDDSLSSPNLKEEPRMNLSKQLYECETDVLIAIAEHYGHLNIFSGQQNAQPRSYQATIKFSTIKGVKLEANSEFKLPFRTAIVEAILNAVEITGSIVETPKGKATLSSLLSSSEQKKELLSSPVSSRK